MITMMFEQARAGYAPTSPCWNCADAAVIRGCVNLARTSDDLSMRDTVLDYLRSTQPATGMDGLSMGMALFYAREVTGQDSYDEDIRQLAAAGWPEIHTAMEAWQVLPFRMAYEFKMNKMAKVHDVARAFQKLHGELEEKDGLYLMALVETIEQCDQQLYEHWRLMVDLYRETLRAMAACGGCQGAACLYAVLKGVQMGLIDGERYLPLARRMMDDPAAQTVYAMVPGMGRDR